MQKGSSAELSEKSEKPCPVGSRCPRKHPSHCPVCGVERDQGFKGRFCSHCVASCNSLFNHQRVAEILGCERCKKVVVKDSRARRAKQPKISKQTGVSKKNSEEYDPAPWTSGAMHPRHKCTAGP